MTLSSVDLPEPDGPMIDTYSPESMSSVMPFSARTSWSPMRNTRVTAVSRIMAGPQGKCRAATRSSPSPARGTSVPRRGRGPGRGPERGDRRRSWSRATLIALFEGLDLYPYIYVLLVEGHQHAFAGCETAVDFGERPVGQPGLQLARFQPAVVAQREHRAVLLDRLGGHAQHVVAALDDHLDVGAVAHQQNLLGRRVEIDLDVDRARLLLHLGHVGGDAPHVAGKGLAGQGVEGDARGLAGLELGRVDFVHRRTHVKTTVVDQIHGRRGGDSGWRGRGEFADLSGDLGHDAGERGRQRGALEPGQGDADLRLRTLDVGDERVAVGLAGAGLGARILGALRADEALGGQLLGALGIALGVGGRDAGLAAALLAGGELARGELALRGEIAVPQFQQRLPGLHAVAFLYPQLDDLAARYRREPGAPARLDRSGAGVDHRGFDRAARDPGEFDFGRLGPGEEPPRIGQRGDSEHDKDKTQPGFRFGHDQAQRHGTGSM